MDANGYVYVADSDAHRVTKFAPDGKVARIIGNPEEDADFEELRDDELSSPMGVAVAPDGTVVVAEATGHTRISRWAADGSYRGAFSTFGVDPGELASPQGLAVGPDGAVYVADTGNDRVSAFAADGTFLRLIGTGASGAGQPGLSSPGGVAVDADGTLWVTDGTFDELKHYAADGTFLGALPIDGDPGFQDGATGVAIGPGHVFHVAHPPSDLVRRWSDAGAPLGAVGNGEGEAAGGDVAAGVRRLRLPRPAVRVGRRQRPRAGLRRRRGAHLRHPGRRAARDPRRRADPALPPALRGRRPPRVPRPHVHRHPQRTGGDPGAQGRRAAHAGRCASASAAAS